jgi:hypothetical protein
MPVLHLNKKYCIDTDAPQVKADGLRVWVGGEAGSGKSNACMLLMSQFLEQGGQVLVLDPHAEYGALWEVRPGGKSRVVSFGYGTNYVESESVDLMLHHLDEGHSLLVDLSHWALRSSVRSEFVASLIAEIYAAKQKRRSRPLLVLVEEAHLFAPQVQTKGDAEAIRNFVNAITGGRKFGLHFVLASQRQSLVDSNVVSQCNLRLFLRVSEQKDWSNVVKKYMPPRTKVTWYRDDKTDLNKFDSGEAVLVSRWFPVERVKLALPKTPVKLFNEEEEE